MAIFEDTLERAKKRAVEPDLLASTLFGQLLPAILTAVTTHPYATISTDLAYHIAVQAAMVEGGHSD